MLVGYVLRLHTLDEIKRNETFILAQEGENRDITNRGGFVEKRKRKGKRPSLVRWVGGRATYLALILFLSPHV